MLRRAQKRVYTDKMMKVDTLVINVDQPILYLLFIPMADVRHRRAHLELHGAGRGRLFPRQISAAKDP